MNNRMYSCRMCNRAFNSFNGGIITCICGSDNIIFNDSYFGKITKTLLDSIEDRYIRRVLTNKRIVWLRQKRCKDKKRKFNQVQTIKDGGKVKWIRWEKPRKK